MWSWGSPGASELMSLPDLQRRLLPGAAQNPHENQSLVVNQPVSHLGCSQVVAKVSRVTVGDRLTAADDIAVTRIDRGTTLG